MTPAERSVLSDQLARLREWRAAYTRGANSKLHIQKRQTEMWKVRAIELSRRVDALEPENYRLKRRVEQLEARLLEVTKLEIP